MHRLGAGPAAGVDDLVDDQIAFGRRRRPDRHRLVGHLDMQRVAVGLGIDRDRLDAHPARGLDDPAGDFAAIGDQDTLEHAAHSSLLRQRCGSAMQSQRQVRRRKSLRRGRRSVAHSAAPPATRQPSAMSAISTAKRPAPDRGADRDLAERVAGDRGQDGKRRHRAALSGCGASRAIDTVTASTSASPTTAAPTIAPAAPKPLAQRAPDHDHERQATAQSRPPTRTRTDCGSRRSWPARPSGPRQ